MPTFFDTPVTITTAEKRQTLVITSLEGAAEQLIAWKGKGAADNPQWRAAITSCAAAIAGRSSPALARSTFIAAAEMAGATIEG